MHELSIAMSIVETAREEAESRGVLISAVYLSLGMLSGVVKDALLFSYDIACDGTPLQGSRLVITEIPVEIYCVTCNSSRRIASLQWFCCPECGTPSAEVVHGKELQVTALEVNS